MLQHSFVLDALETTAADTFLHFEVLIEEHRDLEQRQREYTSAGLTGHHRSTSSLFQQQSRLKQLVPTIGSFHTALPLREAFEIYNKKHQLVWTNTTRSEGLHILVSAHYLVRFFFSPVDKA